MSLRLLLKKSKVHKKIRTRISSVFIALIVLMTTLGSNVLSMTAYAAEDGVVEGSAPAEQAPAEQTPPAEQAAPAEPAANQTAPAEQVTEEAPETVTLGYKAAEGGTVSIEKEDVNVAEPHVQGATAVAGEGYTFSQWTDELDQVIDKAEAIFVPAFDGKAHTYTAHFNKVQAPTSAEVTPESVPAEGNVPAEQKDETASPEGTAPAQPENLPPEGTEVSPAEQKDEVNEEPEKEVEPAYPAASWSGETADMYVSASVEEGVFPEGTEMRVVPVSKAEAIDAAQKMTGDDTEIVDAVAVDITFHYNGAEIQPLGVVNVILTSKRAVQGKNHNAVTIDGHGNAAPVGNASSRTGSFGTTHFTVYGIIGGNYQDTDVTVFARRTYEFYAGNPDADRSTWKKIDTQILRDGNVTEDRLVKPDYDPSGDSKRPFEAWYLWDDAANDYGSEVSFGKVTIDPATVADGATADAETVRVYAKFGELYTLTLYTKQDKTIVYDTVVGAQGTTVKLPAANEISRDEMVIEDGFVFAGWKKDGTADTDIITQVTLDADGIEIVPVFEGVKKVSFVLNYEGIAGIPAMTVPAQNVIHDDYAKAPAQPVKRKTYDGYTLTGWYRTVTDQGGTYKYDDEWSFDSDKVTEDITLYAKWAPETVYYTVEIWQESQSEVGVYEKKYTSTVSGADTYGLKGQPGDAVNIGNVLSYEASKRDKFFHLSGAGQTDAATDPHAVAVVQDDVVVAEYDHTGAFRSGDAAQAVIRGDGKTVVRVYESRDTYRIHFLFRDGGSGRETYNTTGYTTVKNAHQQYLKDLGLPVTNTLAGQVFTLRYKDNLHTNVYQKSNVIETLMDAGWYFNTDYCRNEGGQTVFNFTSTNYNLNPKSSYTDGMDLVCLIYYNDITTDHPFEYHYHKPDDTVEIRRTKIKYAVTFRNGVATNPHSHGFGIGSKTSNGYVLTKIDNGQEVFTSPRMSNGKEQYLFTYTNGKANPLVLHYYPVEYGITFKPNDGAADITAKNTDGSTVFYYGQEYGFVVQDAEGAGDARYRAGYQEMQNGVLKEFQGWYTSASFAGKPFDFTNAVMPASNRVFYGKWVPVECAVVFDADNGSENAEKAVVIGNRVARPVNPEKAGYVFGGWYEDAARTTAYDFNTELTDTVVAEKKDEGVVAEGTAKIHLYAKWNSPKPYKVVYNAADGALTAQLKALLDEGSADKKAYRGNAYATVRGVAEKDGFVFTGWKVGDTLLKDGDSFQVDSTKDAADGASDQTIVLTAQYERIIRLTTVVYHSNYPDGRTDEPDAVIPDVPVVKDGFVVGTVADAAWQDAYEYNGARYVFAGWTNRAEERIHSGTGEYFYPEETVAVTMQNNHLYATWRKIILLDVTVTKDWNDNSNAANARPVSVTARLIADGSVTGQSVVLEETNSWTGTFTKLPETKDDGTPIVYNVQEDVVPANYTVAYTGNVTDGFTITNTYTPPVTPPGPGPDPDPEIPEMPPAPDPEDNPTAEVPPLADAGVPAVLGALRRTDATQTVLGARKGQTGDLTRDHSVMGLMLASLALAELLAAGKKKKKEA